LDEIRFVLPSHLRVSGARSPSSGATGAAYICLRQQRFACLDAFVGGPVWVFDSLPAVERPLEAKVPINLAQLTELWPPLFAIPADPDFAELYAVKALDGFLVRSTPDGIAVDAEVEARWEQLGARPTGPAISAALEALGANTTFPINAKLLIGHPTCDVGGTNITTLQVDNSATDTACPFDINAFRASQVARLYSVGTRKGNYLLDSFNAPIGGGKHVTPSANWSFEWNPSVTEKSDQRLLHTTSGHTPVPIPARRIGAQRQHWLCTAHHLVAGFEILLPGRSSLSKGSVDIYNGRHADDRLGNFDKQRHRLGK
jgi:hypothetical protein